MDNESKRRTSRRLPAHDKLASRGVVFDGQYKLSRYFSPQQHHMPKSIEELYARSEHQQSANVGS
jgi:hypothetical protein